MIILSLKSFNVRFNFRLRRDDGTFNTESKCEIDIVVICCVIVFRCSMDPRQRQPGKRVLWLIRNGTRGTSEPILTVRWSAGRYWTFLRMGNIITHMLFNTRKHAMDDTLSQTLCSINTRRLTATAIGCVVFWLTDRSRRMGQYRLSFLRTLHFLGERRLVSAYVCGIIF